MGLLIQNLMLLLVEVRSRFPDHLAIRSKLKDAQRQLSDFVCLWDFGRKPHCLSTDIFAWLLVEIEAFVGCGFKQQPNYGGNRSYFTIVNQIVLGMPKCLCLLQNDSNSQNKAFSL